MDSGISKYQNNASSKLSEPGDTIRESSMVNWM